MPIGLKGMCRLDRIREGQAFECSCGAGVIESVEARGDGCRVTCVCKRTITVDRSGWYTPAYAPAQQVDAVT